MAAARPPRPAHRRRPPRRVARLGVAAASVVLGLSGAASLSLAPPAAGAAGASVRSAGVPVPATPDFPSWIEGYAGWVPENTCDPVAKPGALYVQQMLRAVYGTSISSNITRACSASDSGHEEGRAIDWMTNSRVPAQNADAKAFLNWLLATDAYGNKFAMARRLGIMYLIYDSRTIFISSSATWTEYHHCLTTETSSSLDTTCHRNHVHISLTWPGAREQSSWYTLSGGLPSCSESGPLTPWTRLQTAVTGSGSGFKAVTVLDTAAAVGTPLLGLPCRVSPDGYVEVPAAGHTTVPAGVAQVTVEVRTAANAQATWVELVDNVRTAHVESSSPARPRLSVPAATPGSVTWTVPLGPSGVFYLHMGPVATDLSVRVTAYRDAGPVATPPWAQGRPSIVVPVPRGPRTPPGAPTVTVSPRPTAMP